jgi:hypothetical protein
MPAFLEWMHPAETKSGRVPLAEAITRRRGTAGLFDAVVEKMQGRWKGRNLAKMTRLLNKALCSRGVP